MSSASRPKTSDKQGICKKLMALLKKHFKATETSADRSVLDTMLFAVFLENATAEEADAGIARLHESFHDLNEIRVSSVTELTAVFEGMGQVEWRAVQVRGILQHIFEKEFAFDFDGLKKKTLDLAQKSIGKVRDASPFVRAFTLQEALGSHIVPLDACQTRAVVWFGLADVGSNEEQASAALRPVLRKNEAPQFCDLLRAFAVDPDIRALIEQAVASPPAEGFDLDNAPARTAQLIADAAKRNAAEKRAARTAKATKTERPKGKASGKPHHEDGGPSAKSRPRSAGQSAKDSSPRGSRPQSRSNPRH